MNMYIYYIILEMLSYTSVYNYFSRLYRIFSNLIGSAWLSKKDIEKQLLETLVDIEVIIMLKVILKNNNNNAKIEKRNLL